jgi:hypothetical protein
MGMRPGFDQQMVSPPLISALTGRFLDKRPRPEIVFRIYEVDFQSQTCVLRLGMFAIVIVVVIVMRVVVVYHNNTGS